MTEIFHWHLTPHPFLQISISFALSPRWLWLPVSDNILQVVVSSTQARQTLSSAGRDASVQLWSIDYYHQFLSMCRLCIVGLAPSHPALQPGREIVKVDFNVKGAGKGHEDMKGKLKRVSPIKITGGFFDSLWRVFERFAHP
jgi:hypothetical protein